MPEPRVVGKIDYTHPKRHGASSVTAPAALTPDVHNVEDARPGEINDIHPRQQDRSESTNDNPTQRAEPTRPDFHAEVRKAVDASKDEFKALEESVKAVTQRLNSIERSRWTKDSRVLRRERADAFSRSARELIDGQRKVLDRINIAFFGRTGAGKSTLMSTFGELNGEYVSPGESDWTKDVTEIIWKGCRLWDTPGINGWGRGMARADLEDVARRAVEVADIVLLCFDSQSQQSTEFQKVARWVQHYGKPVIAVLNVRNPIWHHPRRVPSPIAREALSRAVREHTSNIRSELERIGCHETPIVAIHSQRALFARAKTPFQGPAATSLQVDRENYGVEYLLTNSNFQTLEELITDALTHGGTDIRLRAIREAVRGLMTQVQIDIDQELSDADVEVRRLETRVSKLFTVLGYPAAATAREHMGKDAELIQELERIRSEPFTESLEGTLQRRADHLLKSHLFPIRTATLQRAEEFVLEVVEQGREFDQAQFDTEVYQEELIEKAVQDIADNSIGHLYKELEIASATMGIGTLDLPDRVDIPVSSDAGYRKMAAKILKGGAVGSSFGATAMLAVAGTQFWNPAGWFLAIASFGLFAFQSVSHFVGNRLQNADDNRRAELRSDAVRAAQTAVRQRFTEMELNIRRNLMRHAWEIGGPLVIEAARGALYLRESEHDWDTTGPWILHQAEAIPDGADAVDVLRAAQRTVRERHLPITDAQLWLGESWIGGDKSDSAPIIDDQARHLFDVVRQANTERLKNFLTSAWPEHSGPDLVTWLAEQGDSIDLSQEEHPVVTFIGDYSSGKSSLIKRIVLEAGIASELPAISGAVATDEVREYRTPRFTLVDTPGFQSSNAAHGARTLDAIASAALIVVVLNVNLLIGDPDYLKLIAEESQHGFGKRTRMLFVINRADELGVDPLRAPADFELLKERKASELLDALAAVSVPIDRQQVHVLAADPYGLVGADFDSTVDQFSANSVWDGIPAFIDAFAATTPLMRDTARMQSTVDVVTRLLYEELRATTALLERSTKTVDHSTAAETAIRNGIQDALILADGWRSEFDTIIGPEIDKAKARIQRLTHDEIADANINPILEALQDDTTMAPRIDDFRQVAERQLNRWSAEQASVVGRRIESATSVASMNLPLVDFSLAASSRLNGTPQVVVKVGKFAQKAAQLGGHRDVVYGVGKAVGHNFKPWGAVKLGARIGKAAPIIGGIVAVADGVQFWGEARAREWSATQRRRAFDALEAHRERLAESVLGTVDQPGTLKGELLDRVVGLQETAESNANNIECEDQRTVLLNEEIAHLLAALNARPGSTPTTIEVAS